MPTDSNYPEPDDTTEPTEKAPDSETPDKAAASDKPDTETSLLPLSLFGGTAEVGQSVEFEVIAVHDSEVEIAPKKKDKSSDRQQEMSDAMDMGFASKSKAE